MSASWSWIHCRKPCVCTIPEVRKTGARVIPTSSTRTTAPPASRRAAQPRLVLATRAASVVASGTQKSPSACLPRTFKGPTTPIGIWATPMKFSQLRCEARWTSSEWWPMLASGVRVISSRAWRRISAASSAGRCLGISWNRRSPATSERTSSSRVREATDAELAVLLISQPFYELHASKLRDGFHTEAEHTDLELAHGAPHLVGDPFGRLQGRREEGVGETHDVGAQGDRLRGVQPVAHAAAGDPRHPLDPAHLPDGFGRRQAPAGEQLADLQVAGALGLDAGPARAAHPRRVDDAHPLGRQGARRGFRDAATDLLDHHRHPHLPHHLADLRQQPGEVALPFRLDRLLKRIQVEDQGVGADHLHSLPALAHAHAVIELDGAEIGEQDGLRCDLADAKGISFRRIFQRFALRSHPHGDAGARGPFRQVAVDPAGHLGAAGHRGDEQGGGEPPAQEFDRGVDLVEVDLGERLVREAVVVEIAVAAELHARIERQADVLGLAVALLRAFGRGRRAGRFERRQGGGIARGHLRRAHRSRSRRYSISPARKSRPSGRRSRAASADRASRSLSPIMALTVSRAPVSAITRSAAAVCSGVASGCPSAASRTCRCAGVARFCAWWMRKVYFPSLRSASTGLPTLSGSPNIPSRSSWSWKASPTAAP